MSWSPNQGDSSTPPRLRKDLHGPRPLAQSPSSGRPRRPPASQGSPYQAQNEPALQGSGPRLPLQPPPKLRMGPQQPNSPQHLRPQSDSQQPQQGPPLPSRDQIPEVVVYPIPTTTPKRKPVAGSPKARPNSAPPNTYPPYNTSPYSNASPPKPYTPVKQHSSPKPYTLPRKPLPNQAPQLAQPNPNPPQLAQPKPTPQRLPYPHGSSTSSLPIINRPNVPWALTPEGLLGSLPYPEQDPSPLIEPSDYSHITYSPIDLPVIPPLPPLKPKFSAESLRVSDLETLREPWALSGLAEWVKLLVRTYNVELTFSALVASLSKALVFHMPELGWARLEHISGECARSLEAAGLFVVGGNDTVELDFDARVTGVFAELCGGGCYSQSHQNKALGHCYASRCPKDPVGTRMASVGENLAQGDEMDWARFWNLPSSVVADLDKHTTHRQYALHEFVQTELAFVADLQTYLDVYGDMKNVVPSVIEQQPRFVGCVFSRISAILDSNTVFCDMLKDRQATQGPYIHSLSDIVIEWASAARTVYIAYASDYVWADYHLRKELARSPRLQSWMAARAKDSRLRGRPHSFFFQRVIPRLARYSLLLGTVLKHTEPASEDHALLERAIDGCSKLTRECDARIDTAQRVGDMYHLRSHLVFKDASLTVDLDLGHPTRKLLKQGVLERRSGYGTGWIPSQVFLLDNYLVISKLRQGEHDSAFYVTKPPVPLGLLVVENASQEPEAKKMLTFTTSLNQGKARKKAGDGSDGVTTIDQPTDLLFPLKLTHLGRGGGVYTLYASSSIIRQEWVSSIMKAKRDLASGVGSHQLEPIRVRVVADCFGYPDALQPKLPLHTEAGALHETLYARKAPFPIFKSRINVVSRVTTSMGDVLVAGLDAGLFVCQETAEKWVKVLDLVHVTQVEAVESLNLLVVLADKNLLWFPLDRIVGSNAKRPTGIKINQQRKVSCFKVAVYKERLAIVYLNTALMSDDVVVIVEPVKARTDIGREQAMEVLGQLVEGTVDYFREVDRATFSGLNVHNLTAMKECFILAASKGHFHVNMELKVPHQLPLSEVDANYGAGLDVFCIESNTLALCYELGCLFVDRGGRLVDAPPTLFISQAKAVNYSPPFLFIVSDELIEVYRIPVYNGVLSEESCVLVQLITGKDIRLCSGIEGCIRITMAHPVCVGQQLAIELVAR